MKTTEPIPVRLTRLREAAKLAHDELAKRVGVALSTVYRWEMTDQPSRRGISAKHVRRLAEVLGCDPAELLA